MVTQSPEIWKKLTRDRLLSMVAKGLLSQETASRAWEVVRRREERDNVLRQVAAGELAPDEAIGKLDYRERKIREALTV
jgi:hypothetical protein